MSDTINKPGWTANTTMNVELPREPTAEERAEAIAATYTLGRYGHNAIVPWIADAMRLREALDRHTQDPIRKAAIAAHDKIVGEHG